MADLERIPALTPDEAIRFFEQKSDLPSFAWQDVFQEDHARAFTVAKAMNRDVLTAIREALDQAIKEGLTVEQFRDRLRPKLEALGWWGRQTMLDPLDGQFKQVQLGSPSRLNTIFRVNMRSAYAAGKWQRIEATKKLLPFLRYVQIQRVTARDTHRPWHGTILPADHGWWDQHYPPCDWNCGCTVQQLNARMIAARGWQVTETPPTGRASTYVNPRTGQAVRIEAGIAPGFGFNIGKAKLAGITPRPAGGGTGVALTADLPDPAVEFLAAFGLAPDGEMIFTDAAGWPMAISPALFRDAAWRPYRFSAAQLAALPLAAAALRSPTEIRWVWTLTANGKPELTRRYIWAAAGRAAVFDVGGSGWRLASSADRDFDLRALRTGHLVWKAGDPVVVSLASSRRKRIRKALPRGTTVRPTGGRSDQLRKQGRFAKEHGRHSEAASDALSDRSRQSDHDFGPVGQRGAESVQAGSGYSLGSGYRRVANDRELRHVFNSHGNPSRESARGLRAVALADLDHIPSITARPDMVTLSSRPWTGLRVLEYRKVIGGERMIYAEAIDERRSLVRLIGFRVEKVSAAR